MTIQTLKKLIENYIDQEYNQNDYSQLLKNEIFFFIDLYAEEEGQKQFSVNIPNDVNEKLIKI